MFSERVREQDGGENGEVGCIAYHSTNPTNRTNPLLSTVVNLST